MFDLTGKTALVTGAAQGIGHAATVALVECGAKVIGVDINAAELSKLESIEHVEMRCFDVTDPLAIAAQSSDCGPIDILVNCAGLVHQGTILECGDNDWSRSWDLNVTSIYHLIAAFIPGMVERRGGSIVNISSVVSNIVGAPKRLAYGTAKAAVNGLTKSVASDFVQYGIRCNAIAPGTIDTPSWQQRVSAAPDTAEARKEFMARQPMGRLGNPREVAAAVVYLSSDEAAFVTGTTLIVDGGMSL
tara:strand:- start:1080 stop:1817 length:738 start_codon:yes stop_codon:yes gene_type:complete